MTDELLCELVSFTGGMWNVTDYRSGVWRLAKRHDKNMTDCRVEPGANASREEREYAYYFVRF